jgi:hypothetical protein
MRVRFSNFIIVKDSDLDFEFITFHTEDVVFCH